MEFHQQTSNACNNTLENTSFYEKWSLQDPQSYPWWRRSSAIKTKPNSTEILKKTPFSTTTKLKTASIEKSEKNPFSSPENKSGYVKFKENVDNFEHKNGFVSYVDLKRKTPSTSMEVGKFTKPRCKLIPPDKTKKTHNNLVGENGEKREWVLATVKMFRAKCDEISQSCVDVRRVDLRALEELRKQRLLCCSSSKILGNVPGIMVGDMFKYRVEIFVIGLHGRTQHGIDYMTYNGKSVANCVVAKEGLSDRMCDPEMITYVGEGGVVKTKKGYIYEDQKLVRGNLALMNSMLEKTDVRVVRGIHINNDRVTYVYDGLYKVVSYEKQRRFTKNMVFEFKLKRCPGQPVVSLV